MIYSILICVKYYFYWAIITFFLIIPYGILQENMSRPNILIKTLDQKYDVKQLDPGIVILATTWVTWRDLKPIQDIGSISIEQTGKSIYYDDYTLVTKIFKNAYFHIFGELFIDEKYDPQEPDQCKQTLSRPGPGVTCPDYVSYRD